MCFQDAHSYESNSNLEFGLQIVSLFCDHCNGPIYSCSMKGQDTDRVESLIQSTNFPARLTYVLLGQESLGSIRLNRLHPRQPPPPSPATLCPSTPFASRRRTPWTEVEKMKSMGVAGKAIGMWVARQPFPLFLLFALSIIDHSLPRTGRARLKLHHVAL